MMIPDQLVNIFRKLSGQQPLNESEFGSLLLHFKEADDKINNLYQKGTSIPSLRNPIILNPNFRTSFTHLFQVALVADTAIANNTLTEITFDFSTGDTSVFNFFDDDPKKINVSQGLVNFRVEGIIRWEGNSTGYRLLNIHFYQKDGTSIGTQEILNVAATPVEATTLSFSYPAHVQEITDLGYIVIEVKQNSGGDLDVVNLVVAVSMA